jgi:hypothetical protein
MFALEKTPTQRWVQQRRHVSRLFIAVLKMSQPCQGYQAQWWNQRHWPDILRGSATCIPHQAEFPDNYTAETACQGTILGTRVNKIKNSVAIKYDYSRIQWLLSDCNNIYPQLQAVSIMDRPRCQSIGLPVIETITERASDLLSCCVSARYTFGVGARYG